MPWPSHISFSSFWPSGSDQTDRGTCALGARVHTHTHNPPWKVGKRKKPKRQSQTWLGGRTESGSSCGSSCWWCPGALHPRAPSWAQILLGTPPPHVDLKVSPSLRTHPVPISSASRGRDLTSPQTRLPPPWGGCMQWTFSKLPLAHVSLSRPRVLGAVFALRRTSRTSEGPSPSSRTWSHLLSILRLSSNDFLAYMFPACFPPELLTDFLRLHPPGLCLSTPFPTQREVFPALPARLQTRLGP